MQSDSIVVTYGLKTIPEWIELIANVVTIVGGGGLLGLIVYLCTKFLPSHRVRKRSQLLEGRIGAELYSKGVIEQTIRYYIEPDCQSVDPSGGEEPRLILATKQKLFSTTDNALKNPTEYRYIILLADSGMGKTSFLINYYARNLFGRRNFDLVLLPLGIPEVDKLITEIPDKKNKILLLDAFDEDTLAIVDHAGRLHTLMKLTRDFNKILITCRTQFFPKDEEIPRETGIVKVGPRKAGEGAQYVFHKLYLAPFTDQQVVAYLKKRYPWGQKRRRNRALEMVQKIPHLSVRPMLLARIEDLVRTEERKFKYCFELYEEMVEAWLIREERVMEGTKIKKEPLHQFSELLAIDLYRNREQRGAERIPRDELAPLAKKWNIPLDDWQLTGRSLLNRDALGNYKFAHRSIMEYLFVKRFLEIDPELRFKVVWNDQMKKFLREILSDCNDKNLPFPDLTAVDLRGIGYLRSQPTRLSTDEVKKMLKRYDFFDSDRNKEGNGFEHQYEDKTIKGDKLVLDHASNLMRQRGGSSKDLTFEGAKKWIDKLKKEGYAGFHDWRLPTLEEAMSLIEPQKKKNDLYIDPIFDKTQRWIWTSDLVQGESRAAWIVGFYGGYCYWYYFLNLGYMRAVRSGQSSPE